MGQRFRTRGSGQEPQPPPHLNADRVSLSSGGCPCGSRDNHGGHSSGQSLVLSVSVNTCWLEMHRERLYFRLWTSVFTNFPQNQLGCSHFSCRVPRVFPCISPAERSPACSSAGAQGERTSGSGAAGTRRTAQHRGNPRPVVAPQEKDVAEFPCRRQTCPCVLTHSLGSIAATALPHTYQQPCWDSQGTAQPRGPGEPQPAVAGWFGTLHHTRCGKSCGQDGELPMCTEKRQGQRKPWPGGGLGTAGTGPEAQPWQGTAAAQDRDVLQFQALPSDNAHSCTADPSPGDTGVSPAQPAGRQSPVPSAGPGRVSRSVPCCHPSHKVLPGLAQVLDVLLAVCHQTQECLVRICAV